MTVHADRGLGSRRIGAALSLMMLAGDFQKLRSHEPHVATGLWAPEFHVILALLTGGGSWMAWGWIAGFKMRS